MKTISIKLFFTLIIITAIVYQSIAFYAYYQKSKTGIATLLKENIQTNMINLKHIIEKNIKIDNVNNIVANLDNYVASSEIMKDVHIVNNHNKLLYSSDRENSKFHEDTKCVQISQTLSSDIFSEECYYFTVKLHDRLRPYYYYTYIYTNKDYKDSLLKKQVEKYTILFTFLTFIFLLLLWFSLKAIVITPLKELKHYAYYSENPPLNFFIQEIESIRYSLTMTFKRMKEEQQKLYDLSTKDPLSGLYNRLSLIEKINWLIAQSKRTNQGFTLIFLDLDDFKNINDSYGHEFGDMVLKEISEVIQSSLRSNDIISRFGGDEFVIILPNITDVTNIVEVLSKLQKKLFMPICHQEFTYNTTSSMGVVIYPKDGDDATSLLKNADIAMYKSKALGKNSFSFFTNELNEELKEKLRIKSMIELALKNNGFELHYQPQIDISSGKIIGCEALIRMIDPIEGMVPPNKFIPIAEQNNLIVPLGQWILKEATSQLKKWENTPLSELKLSINVSALELNHKDFLSSVEKSIQDIDHKKLSIELTESVLMNNFKNDLPKIHKLKEMGLTLSLDDFGTGYSSLSYLKNIPFDFLKIDKSFIDDILEDPKDKMFVQIIIDIAQTMNLTVVAEGVELKAQLTMLEQLGCHIYQGYYCSKPLKCEEFEKLFLSHKNYN
ncbi:putative bifunctional diguanylate cyclase/phosphodiesterase [Sulfurimonas marina]|uniref:EAL domain-containing protein n=1 Tax=Sulfurimonas marina TaxID=2590551 RepID=A0A7M1AVP2_9BACT|nr:EAL domain-containing protein [Sulfurimonas marina]QOP41513.1 EAL domain-containing protein [Sulfurimonas marina]